MAGPLTGIRVLDLSRVMAGPWCTQILADLGAEIIKVERPETGDETREWGPPWLASREDHSNDLSAYYIAANRGKHSLALDIKQTEGQEIIRRLAADSDILVENFMAGTLARYGLGYDDLKRINPGIVYCSITGFGQDGPRADEAGYDYLIQGMGGLMSLTGIEDGQPGAGSIRSGLPIADLATGLYATIAILAALRHRDISGAGQHIDMALLDAQIGILGNQAQNYFVSGNCPTRTGRIHPNLAPYQPFPASDGEIVIAVGNDRQFARLCAALEAPGLASDPRFAANPDRVKNRSALADAIAAITVSRKRDEWIARLKSANVPCGPINDLRDVFADPQVRHRGMRQELEHPVLGSLAILANPMRFSETGIEYHKAPPLLGEDTDRILTDRLGYTAAEIERLRKQAVIQ
jgi:crotonobetainyl-CoA:carnitine CoA-transferase CaiB-like acyl-CoA transferase